MSPGHNFTIRTDSILNKHADRNQSHDESLCYLPTISRSESCIVVKALESHVTDKKSQIIRVKCALGNLKGIKVTKLVM